MTDEELLAGLLAEAELSIEEVPCDDVVGVDTFVYADGLVFYRKLSFDELRVLRVHLRKVFGLPAR